MYPYVCVCVFAISLKYVIKEQTLNSYCDRLHHSWKLHETYSTSSLFHRFLLIVISLPLSGFMIIALTESWHLPNMCMHMRKAFSLVLLFLFFYIFIPFYSLKRKQGFWLESMKDGSSKRNHLPLNAIFFIPTPILGFFIEENIT